nr:unnamed protein product [Spirometra erinaceieuropaei]
MTLKLEEESGALAESTEDGPKAAPERPTYAQVRQFVEDVAFLRGRDEAGATAFGRDELAPAYRATYNHLQAGGFSR